MSNHDTLGKPERFLYGVLSLFLFAFGCLFLVINSYLLAAGAARYGYGYWDKLALSSAAAAFPWLIAVLPLLIKNTWIKVFGIPLPTGKTIAVMGVWCVFVGYNLTNGMGSVASTRIEVVSSKDHANSTLAADKERRLALIDEAKGISQARPAAAVAALIAGERLKRTWDATDNCKDPSNKTQRAFCVNVQSLEAEQQQSERRAQIQTEVAALDAKIAATGETVGANSDPQAELIHALACTMGCVSKESIALWLPAMTPIALEIGAATTWAFAGMAFMISLGRRQPPAKARSARPGESGHEGEVVSLLATRERLAADSQRMSEPELMDSRKTAHQFFSMVATPAIGSSLSEEQWLDHYRHYCQVVHAQPVPRELFRRIASEFITDLRPNAKGEMIYWHTLPLLDKALRKEDRKEAAE